MCTHARLKITYKLHFNFECPWVLIWGTTYFHVCIKLTVTTIMRSPFIVQRVYPETCSFYSISTVHNEYHWCQTLSTVRFINPRCMRRRVTVVVLCVCVCVCVCVCLSVTTKSAAYSFLRRKQSFIGFFVVFSTFLPFGFPWKRFVQELWRHLPVTAAFLAPWRTFDGQTRQRWLLFNSKSIYGWL